MNKIIAANMNNEEKSTPKIALFDFCETLVKFQTANEYLKYVICHEKPSLRISFLELIRKHLLLPGIRGILGLLLGSSPEKILLQWELKGLPKSLLEQYANRFYVEMIKPNLIPEVIAEWKKLQERGYKVYIVSGGYDIYIRLFAVDYGAAGYISSKLLFSHGVFTGKLDGRDCIGRNKIKALESFFHKKNLGEISSVAFSDSKSDLHFLKYCRDAVVVSKGKPSWMTEEMKLIKWG